MADTPRPADPLTETLEAVLRAWERNGAPNRKSLAAFGLQATLDTARAPRSDDALRAAAQTVVSAWVDDESGMETFDPSLIDRLAEALGAS